MENLQIQKIIELSQAAYNQGFYEEAWNGLKTAFLYTNDSYIKELLLNYYHEPYKNILRKNFFSNISLFRNHHNYFFKEDFSLSMLEKYQVLWIKEINEIYFFLNNELKNLSLLKCEDDIKERTLYINISPNNLPELSDKLIFLYYDTEILKLYMQLYSFKNIFEKETILVFIDEELENYIKQNSITDISIIGFNIEYYLERIKNANLEYIFSERKVSFGNLYKDEIFYIIRVKPTPCSIGALLLFIYDKLELTDKAGYIPIIDFSCFSNIFLLDDELGIINSWEYYFEQPTHFSLSAAYHAQNVILGAADASAYSLDKIIDDRKTFNYVCYLFNKYIHLNKRIEKKVLSIYNQIIKSNWNVLGVVYRGTDYRNRPVPGEHKQPSLEEVIAKTKDLIVLWKCDHIFLATEDLGAVSEFKAAFGDILVYTEKERYPSETIYTQTYSFNRKYDAYLKGEEYLIEICILSKCDSLLASKVGILVPTLSMNDQKYKHTYIYDLGFYTPEDYMNETSEKN